MCVCVSECRENSLCVLCCCVTDTRWLAHEWCVKAVKVSYTALVVALESNYQNFHAPEAFGLYKALSKYTTIGVCVEKTVCVLRKQFVCV